MTEYLENVKIVYISNYYDLPISGHAWYKNEYYYFFLLNPDEIYETDESEAPAIYGLYEFISLEEKLRAITRRMIFQDCIGYHCTRQNGTRMGHYRVSDSVLDVEFDPNTSCSETKAHFDVMNHLENSWCGERQKDDVQFTERMIGKFIVK